MTEAAYQFVAIKHERNVMEKRATAILALCLCILSSCSKSGQINQNHPARDQPSPKKTYYFVRKVNGKMTALQPEMGENKDAERVEGQIAGPIVQASEGAREKTKEGKYIYTFMVTDGKDIEMIDSNGMYQSVGSNITVLAANLDKPDISDLEILQTGMASKATTATGLRLPSGGTMGRFVFKTSKQSAGTLKLMGEFRSDQNKGQLLPALQINTDHGVVSIPVDQLIRFKKKTEQPTPGK
jgi:hypothetical protein